MTGFEFHQTPRTEKRGTCKSATIRNQEFPGKPVQVGPGGMGGFFELTIESGHAQST